MLIQGGRDQLWEDVGTHPAENRGSTAHIIVDIARIGGITTRKEGGGGGGWDQSAYC